MNSITATFNIYFCDYGTVFLVSTYGLLTQPNDNTLVAQSI